MKDRWKKIWHKIRPFFKWKRYPRWVLIAGGVVLVLLILLSVQNVFKKKDAPQEISHIHGEVPSGHAAFRLSVPRQQLIGVKLGKVERKPLFKSIFISGRAAFDPELYTAQNEYLEAFRQFQTTKNSPLADVRQSAERMVESAKVRLQILGLSDDQIAGLGETGTTGATLLIPKIGENIWIYAEAYEMDLPFIQRGLDAKVSGSSLGGNVLTGKVVSVDRVINTATRTATVRISLADGSVALRPESFVDVTILAPLGEQVAVPFDAIFETGKEAWVFIAHDDGTFEPRMVKIKVRAGDEIAVEGVHAGEQIVTSANFLIDSESRLKATKMEEIGKEGAKPKCPKGQYWHAEMSMCMPGTGE